MPTVAVSREQKLEFNGRTHLLRKMTLGQYAKFSQKLEELLPDRAQMQALLAGEPADRVQALMDLFKRAPERFAELMEVATGIPVEQLLESTPDEVFDLAAMVYEFNEIDRLGDRIKKVLSLGALQADQD
jgi:hypothetical protein